MAVITDLLESPYLVHGVVVTLALVLLSSLYDDVADGYPYRRIPVIGWNLWNFTNRKAKARFVSSARELITEGFTKGRNAFQLLFSFRSVIVLHPRFLNEVKGHPLLSFEEANKKSFFGGKLPGFEVFSGDGADIMKDVINKKLTHSLGQITIPLSRETAIAVKDTFSEPAEWTSVAFAQKVPHMVARVSAFVFMGSEICRNEDWLDVSVNYTIDTFIAAREIRLWPSVLRPLIHWFLPSAQRVRKHMQVGRMIIEKELSKRATLVQEREKEGTGAPKRQTDSLDWIDEIADGRPLDRTRAQVGLSLAAIHTTSNLLTNVMYDLTAYPEYITALREEIKRVVIEDEGILKKTSLLKMKLLDSVLKETQRMNPVSMTSLHRYATDDIPLSDGTIIPKGASLVVSAHDLEDSSIYSNPQTFDGSRFLNKRKEPGNEHRFQFVTTSPEHLGFGHGIHACPGRFFAANEVKILLIHMLLKYDWMFEGERSTRPRNFENGTEIICDPTVMLRVRARVPEVGLAALGEVSC